MAENARLTERVTALEKENTELRERVTRLERLLSRNSGNSGMSSAGDDLPGKTQPKAKPGRGAKRRPGKQPGAPGATLAWSDDPDDTLDHFPSGMCGCGAALTGAADLGVTARHQQVEVPLMSATTIQHNLHTVACGCGKVHTAARPPGVSSAPNRSGSGTHTTRHSPTHSPPLSLEHTHSSGK
ncbi:DUF6444 domain-containing protein [Streptosporangium sp. NBC_01755]|uniref:DUF6444 domain-containing protein n=1 Tax=unclassified Streptosporangium TaxID=2632669 RepID=UPI002DDAC180|nr:MULTISPECIES: DUF6444 domain-containing protein [unclassified Streptosporangium]WSA28401.1 DUF6444 domain-containing protein [Streptosporangium sp. NBC_01810]WSD00109.1 DUF6444 domain-containing protein [Streptosporangium sp. NBC_01755]